VRIWGNRVHVGRNREWSRHRERRGASISKRSENKRLNEAKVILYVPSGPGDEGSHEGVFRTGVTHLKI
jgi:fibrillarin-like rRNA methylase